MNDILSQVEKYMHEALKEKLPEVSLRVLEDNGAVFYMNGKNGTAFDWYVNDHLPCFFMFYGNKENLGAVKAMLYNDCNMSIYVYGDKGHAEPSELNYDIDTDEKKLFELAVLLTDNADSKKVWDADIRKISSDGTPAEESVKLFTELKEAFAPSIAYRDILGKTAILSKKIREEGWKIGYGERLEPTREGDSGWFFSAGNESSEYINNPKNLELWLINSVVNYDSALREFITAPYDTAVIRTGHDKFEIDAPGKKMLVEKK